LVVLDCVKTDLNFLPFNLQKRTKNESQIRPELGDSQAGDKVGDSKTGRKQGWCKHWCKQQIIDTFQAYVDGLNTCRRLKREQDII
jgi:hypothetical protein